MSNNNIGTQETTFWNYLKNNNIVIPIIQRDYAQGRLGKEYLRKNFLGDLKKALDNEPPYKNSKMKLDFVYGSTENGILNPLDGQQRLTTLWLLHWYIALRAGKLKEAAETLICFSYETRISSREFCEKLCNPEHFTNFSGNDIVGFITKQTWFYSAWKQDPTIQSMLRMLGGTKITDKKGEDIVDGIEELFTCPNECGITEDGKCALLRGIKGYWNKLTGENCPIVFYSFPLKDFGLSDDLYIKMNARGKQLTAFENFKADLIGYIRKQAQAEDATDKTRWVELINPNHGIPNLMDTTWTDIFWKYRNGDLIDEIYFAFINRIFFSELICQKGANGDYLHTAEKLEKEDFVFAYLYGNESNDSNIEYVGIEKYGMIQTLLLDNLMKTLNHYSYKLSCNPVWEEGESFFHYIPNYQGASISTLGRKERVVFLAVSRYLQKGEIDDTFGQWMRVVWNIIENAGITSISSMIGAMRLIDEISEHSHDIYSFLVEQGKKKTIRSNMAQGQITEEIAKATLIKNGTFTEKEIINAEMHPLLKGCISVLFEDDSCNLVSHHQTLQNRVALLDSLYNEHDVNDYTLIKILIPFFTDSITGKRALLLKKDQSNWKTLVTNKLKYCFRQLKTKDDRADCTFEWQRMLSDTNLLENSRNDGKILGCYGNHVVLWATNGCSWNAYDNVILDKFHHNLLLSNLVNKKVIRCNQKVNETVDFFWGWNIDFVYNDQNGQYYFRWYAYPNENELDIYLMEDNWKDYVKRHNHTTDKGTKEDDWYCFRVDRNETCESFIRKLDCLIAQAYPKSEGKIVRKTMG